MLTQDDTPAVNTSTVDTATVEAAVGNEPAVDTSAAIVPDESVADVGESPAAPPSALENDTTSNSALRPSVKPPADRQFKVLDDSPEFVDMMNVVTDKTLELKRFEMPAYWRLFRESSTLTYDQLRENAVPVPTLNQLMLHPANYRAGLFHQPFVVRTVRKFDDVEMAEGKPGLIYEIWGSTENAPLWLQILVTDSLPPGQTEESLPGKTIDMAGYFFKLQAYYPAKAKSSDRSMISPLFIGKAELAVEQAPPPPSSTRFVSTETMFALLAGLLILSFLLKNMVRSHRPSSTNRKRRKADWDWIDENQERNLETPHASANDPKFPRD